MAVKGIKSIAELMIREWMQSTDLVASAFQLTMQGNEGILRDVNGDTLTLVYDNEENAVYVRR